MPLYFKCVIVGFTVCSLCMYSDYFGTFSTFWYIWSIFDFYVTSSISIIIWTIVLFYLLHNINIFWNNDHHFFSRLPSIWQLDFHFNWYTIYHFTDPRTQSFQKW